MSFASTLKQAAHTMASKGYTWNGDINYRKMGDDIQSYFLELDQKAVRKTDVSVQLEHLISRIDLIKDNTSRAAGYSILFRWLFYIRAIRGLGKGERKIFYDSIHIVYKKFPETIVDLFPLIPDKGCYKDFYTLFITSDNKVFKTSILEFIIFELDKDIGKVTGKTYLELDVPTLKTIRDSFDEMEDSKKEELFKSYDISLIAKWHTSEGKSGDKKADIVGQMIKQFTGQKLTRNSKQYRYEAQKLRLVKSILNKVLNIVETHMCKGAFHKINHKTTPAGATHKYSKAYLNEIKDEVLAECDIETGNRSKDPRRIKCRQNILEAVEEGELKGATLQIVDIGDKIFKCFKQGHGDYGHGYSSNLSRTVWGIDPAKLSSSQRKIFCIQWSKALEEVKKIINEARTKAIEEGKPIELIDMFKNVIPVIDVSGSMSSYNVMSKAIALGIMCSELSDIKDIAITFSDEPSPIDLSRCVDIVDKFNTILNTPWGYSTNADKVFKLILDIADKTAKITGKNIKEFIPGAVVMFTDGQFNSMCPNLNDKTLLERCQEQLKIISPDSYMYRMVFWNLNGTSLGFPAETYSDNVQLVSGYSQSLFRMIMVGDYTIVEKDGIKSVNVDPWDTFIKAVSNESFDIVLNILENSDEGILKFYKK